MTEIKSSVPAASQKTSVESFNIRTLLGALQALEAKAASTPNHPVLAEMTLAELNTALQQMNINCISPITGELNQFQGPQTAETIEAANARRGQEVAAAEKMVRYNARRQAIEDAFQTQAGISLERRPLNPSPTLSRVDDFSDLAYADLSSFAPSEIGTTESVDLVEGVEINAGPPGVDAVETSIVDQVDGPRAECSAESFSPKVILNPDGGVKAIICGKADCRAYNLVDTTTSSAGGSRSWYAVIKGKSVGVFYGWDVVGPLVTGVSCANYTKNTEEKVREIYQRALLAGTVEVRPF